jgi:ornithine cyclodeaminase/alanine dehydrogenase-like protein (mu-crystallin family)
MELYLISRNSKNPKLKQYYKSYCKILSKVIKEEKILQYKKQILSSDNKSTTIWNTVKSKTGKEIRKEEITLLNINGNLIQNQQIIANSFNDYFFKNSRETNGSKSN